LARFRFLAVRSLFVLGLAIWGSLSPRDAHAQTDFKVLHAFGAPPLYPVSGLVQGSDGAFYGMTEGDGLHAAGTIFRYDPSTSTITVVHDFESGETKVHGGGMVRGSDGTLYGLTIPSAPGGTGRGTIFRYDIASASVTTLYLFEAGCCWTDGGIAFYGGALYGTDPGPSRRGRLFKFDLATGAFATLHLFDGINGRNPRAAPMVAADGRLYGTTSGGGALERGTIYRYDLEASTFTVVHRFGENAGAFPECTLVEAADGALYGTVSIAGAGDDGTIFRYVPSTAVTTLLHAEGPTGINADGTLLRADDGLLYGQGRSIGPSSTLFSFDPVSSAITLLHTFGEAASPRTPLLQGEDGALYGVASGRVTTTSGTLFRYDLASSSVATLHTFDEAFGLQPVTLVRASDGSFYGTTAEGGDFGKGTIFRRRDDGKVVTVHHFDGTHGEDAWGGLVQAGDGALYGTTRHGGSYGGGTLYRFDPSTNKFEVRHEFQVDTTGAYPAGPLVESGDGALYGTTIFGGPTFGGTIFRFDPYSSTLVALHSFVWDEEGTSPFRGVIVGADGALFGTTGSGGEHPRGTLFRYDTSSGTLTILHAFAGSQPSYANGDLLQGTDGALYGVRGPGGVNGAGEIFRYDLATSTYAVMHSFPGPAPALPFALIQGSDGMLYGTTTQGGSRSQGTVFRFQPDSAAFTTLRTLQYEDGSAPLSLLQGPDGLLYGVGNVGGQRGGGTLFSLSTLAPSADLVITKTDHRTSVEAGETLWYTISVENNGPDPMTQVTVADEIPEALLDATWTCAAGAGGACTPSGAGNIHDAAADLRVGARLTYTLTATVAGTAKGTVTNVASVTPPVSTTDFEMTNNAATDMDIVIAHADLAVQKSNGQTTSGTGQSVTYTITASNLGPDAVIGATVTDTLPAALTGAIWTCAGSGGGTCTASGSGSIVDSVKLPVGASVAYSLSATVSADATGSLANTATVSVPEHVVDSVSGNDTATDTDSVLDQTAPTLTVIAPHGGETLFVGTAYQIEWTAADNIGLSGFDVAVSTNGGATFAAISGCTGLPGSARGCAWSPSAPPAAQAVVRVTAHDAAGNSAQDATDASFRVVRGTASITLLAPAPTDRWTVGTTRTIRWRHNLRANSAVDIEISRDAGATWTIVALGVANETASTGRYDWLVTGPPASNVRLRVSWTGNEAVKEVGKFAIGEPAVTVTAPNTAVAWRIGRTYRVRWTHNLGAAEPVNVEVSRDGGGTWTSVVSGTPNTGGATGYYDWVVSGPPTTEGRIRVSWADDTSVSDVSNVDFTIRE
jgi:uncharacterized repeat protein (TIGR01451 family)